MKKPATLITFLLLGMLIVLPSICPVNHSASNRLLAEGSPLPVPVPHLFAEGSPLPVPVPHLLAA